jgi:hypothetical protein
MSCCGRHVRIDEQARTNGAEDNKPMLGNTFKTGLQMATTMALFGIVRALADAQEKIDRYAQGLPLETAEMHPATVKLMIVNPLSRSGIAGMFSTHPPTAERIHRLLAMAA